MIESALTATPTINFQDPRVLEFIAAHRGESRDAVDQAVSLYDAVRDGIRYDPYAIDLSVEGLCAGTTLKNGRGWCVAKAILLAACCRGVGIPARLGFADVRNHLTTERLRARMGTDLFYWHGYTVIHLNGRWIKATPAFNIELCRKMHLHPLEFDGQRDSLYHPFDLSGNRHMEYVTDRGVFDDVPIAAIRETFLNAYGADDSLKKADFTADVEAEAR